MLSDVIWQFYSEIIFEFCKPDFILSQ